MSEQLTLPAETRDRAGKGASRALRRDGRVPAVVYGEKKEPLSIHVEEKLLSKMLSTGPLHELGDDDRRSAARRIGPCPRRWISTRSAAVRSMSISCASASTPRSPSRCRCASTMKRPRPASSAAACSTSSSTRSSWSATRRTFRKILHVDLDGLDIGDSHPHQRRSRCPKGVKPAIDDRDFTVATIVAPSAMKSEEGEDEAEAAEGEVPTVGDEEAGEGEASEGEASEGGEE